MKRAKPHPPRLDEQTCFALYSASRAFTRAYAPLLDELGLTYPQYLVMLVLWEQDDVSVGELGARLVLDSGTLTPLLKRLAEHGLVARARGTDDERVVRIRLTSAGAKLGAKAAEIPSALMCRVEAGSGAIVDLAQLRALRAAAMQLARVLDASAFAPAAAARPRRRGKR